MGCDECTYDETPEHEVELDDFWIDKFEITNSDYVPLLNHLFNEGDVSINYEPWDGGERTFVQIYYFNTLIMNWVEGEPGMTYSESGFSVTNGYENYPVTVSWTGARIYCENWRRKRLPTEAEWEYAARGGRFNQDFRYSGSDDPDLVAWHRLNSYRNLHPIGEKDPNELGIYDMSGNLREWVNDWYGYYSAGPQLNPQGPTIGSEHVLRGGSYFEEFNLGTQPIEESLDPELVRVTKRSWVMG